MILFTKIFSTVYFPLKVDNDQNDVCEWIVLLYTKMLFISVSLSAVSFRFAEFDGGCSHHAGCSRDNSTD